MAMELRMTVITGVLELRSGLNPSGQLVVSVYKVVFYIGRRGFVLCQIIRLRLHVARLYLHCGISHLADI